MFQNYINKFGFTRILRVSLYFLSACVMLFLSRMFNSFLFSLITALIYVCLFALFCSHTGFKGAVFIVLPLLAVLFTDGYQTVLLTLPSLLLASAIGLSMKSDCRPCESVIISTVIYSASSLLFNIISVLVGKTFSSPADYFSKISSMLDQLFVEAAAIITETTGTVINNLNAIMSTAKILMIGGILSAFLCITIIYYYATVLISQLTRDHTIYKGTSLYDIKPSRISAWVYIICFILSSMISSDVKSEIHFYTYLPTNISIILTPIFTFTGIYYLKNIRVKAERKSLAFPLVILIISILLGMYQLIILYLNYCGLSYTLKREGTRFDISQSNG